jgi:hypothetical protein
MDALCWWFLHLQGGIVHFLGYSCRFPIIFLFSGVVRLMSRLEILGSVVLFCHFDVLVFIFVSSPNLAFLLDSGGVLTSLEAVSFFARSWEESPS